MLSIKRLFEFDYYSPLDVETCRERLSPEYKLKLLEEGIIKSDIIGWDASTPPYKDQIRVQATWTFYTFCYFLTLEKSENGTILHCKHNPFGLFSLGPHVAFVMPVLIYTLWYSIQHVDFSGIVPLLYFLLIFLVIPLVVLESFARRSVDKRLALLEARQVK